MIFLVRHAKAGSRSDFHGEDDSTRPLSKAGWRQSKALVDRLLAAGATGPLLASPYARCVQTLGPLAEQLSADVVIDHRLAEGQRFEPMLDLMTTTPNGTVLCSHGDMIPAVMAALERRGCNIENEPNWKKATVWVLTRDNEGHFTHAACWPPPAE